MEEIKKGDVVGRISYKEDILFVVKKIIVLKDRKKIAILKGITERIEADSEFKDLHLIPREKVKQKIEELDVRVEKRILNEQKNKKDIQINENRLRSSIVTGKILHLDGDRKYSEKSLKYYRRMGLNAIVKNVSEYMQPRVVYTLLVRYRPDVIVLTGHDGMIRKETGYNDIYNYRNSKYFIEAVKEAKRYERDNNRDISIFAGACQSYFEALILAGANFASSPARILIDILDPLIVAERIATTSYTKYLTIDDIENNLRDGKRGIGGVGSKRKKNVMFM